MMHISPDHCQSINPPIYQSISPLIHQRLHIFLIVLHTFHLPQGDAFDPALHDALYSAPAEGKKSGTIAQVLKAGYKLKDRVLRPAQVGTVA